MSYVFVRREIVRFFPEIPLNVSLKRITLDGSVASFAMGSCHFV